MASKYWRDEIWSHNTEFRVMNVPFDETQWIERCAVRLRSLRLRPGFRLDPVRLSALEDLMYCNALFPDWCAAVDGQRLTRLSGWALSKKDPIFASAFNFPSLRKLNLHYYSYKVSRIVISHLNRMPSLERLALTLPTDGPVEELIAALPHLPRLRCFESTCTAYPFSVYALVGTLQEVWTDVLRSSVAFASVLNFTSSGVSSFEAPRQGIGHILIACIFLDKLEWLRYFVGQGLPVDLEVYDTRETALEYAIEENRLDFVDELLKMGANVNHCPKNRLNPLARSLISNARTLALLEAGAEPIGPSGPAIWPKQFFDTAAIAELARRFPWTANQRIVVSVQLDDTLEYETVLTPLAVAVRSFSGSWEAFDSLWEASDAATRKHFATATDARGWNALAYYLHHSPLTRPPEITKLIKFGLSPFVEILDATGHKRLLFCRILDKLSLSVSGRFGDKYSNLNSADFGKFFAAVVERYPILPNFSHLLHNSLIAKAAVLQSELIIRRLFPTLQPTDLSLWAALYYCLQPPKLALGLFCQILTLNEAIQKLEDVKDEDIKVDLSIRPDQLDLIRRGKLFHPVRQLLTGAIADPRIWQLLLRAGLDLSTEFQVSSKAVGPRVELLKPLSRFLLMSGVLIEKVLSNPTTDATQALNLNYVGPGGATALMIAASAGEPSNVRYILARSTQAQIEKTDAQGFTAFFYALHKGLDLSKVNSATVGGYTLLVGHGTVWGRVQTAQALLDAGLGFTEANKKGVLLNTPTELEYPLYRLIITAMLPVITAANTTRAELAQLLSTALSVDSSIADITALLKLEWNGEFMTSLRHPVEALGPMIKRDVVKALEILSLMFDHSILGPPLLSNLTPSSPLVRLLIRTVQHRSIEGINLIMERVGKLPVDSFLAALTEADFNCNFIITATLLRAAYVGDDYSLQKLAAAVAAADLTQCRLKLDTESPVELLKLSSMLKKFRPLKSSEWTLSLDLTDDQRRYIEATFEESNPFLAGAAAQPLPVTNPVVSFAFPLNDTAETVPAKSRTFGVSSESVASSTPETVTINPFASFSPSPSPGALGSPFSGQSGPTPSEFSSSGSWPKTFSSAAASSPTPSVSPFAMFSPMPSPSPSVSAPPVVALVPTPKASADGPSFDFASFSFPSNQTPTKPSSPSSGDAVVSPFSFGAGSVPSPSSVAFFGSNSPSLVPGSPNPFAPSPTRLIASTPAIAAAETPASASSDLSSLFASLSFASPGSDRTGQ